jgi:hypothetical protein
MKKVTAIITSSAGFLLNAGLALAQPTRDTKVTFGGAGVDPNQRSVGDVISNALMIVFIAAGLAVLIYLIIGAFKWITSGGDKDAIGKARGTIVNALIGLAILALAFFITVLFGQILNIDILNFGPLPSLNDAPRRTP